jgi:hypothetical protein
MKTQNFIKKQLQKFPQLIHREILFSPTPRLDLLFIFFSLRCFDFNSFNEFRFHSWKMRKLFSSPPPPSLVRVSLTKEQKKFN